MTLYTDHDPACCEVLRARVMDGGLTTGDIAQRDIRDLDAATLERYHQVHLFCGIGGSPLGFKWAGWPQEWPLVTGGFPCQDISSAGKGAGLDGERSGLFWEMHRVIDTKRPLGVFAENVGALSARGLDRVASSLESLGYWVEALRMGAWAVGAPDKRERWWFVCRRMADVGGAGRVTGRRILNDQAFAGSRGREPDSGRQRGAVADLAGGGPGAERIGSAGTVPDQPDTGVDLGDQHGRRRGQREPGRPAQARRTANGAGAIGGVGNERGSGLQGLRAGAPGPDEWQHLGEADSREPTRHVHPRWYIIDEEGREKTVPTPQHDWEPPRLFPGTRTVNARWRLALMGYPTHWLDIGPERLAALTAGKRNPDRWWNKQGVAMTGNAQNARCVALLARAMIESFQAVH